MSIDNYSLIILAAGAGSRSGFPNLNKGMLPINHRAVISLILDKFPKEMPVIISVGWKAESLIEFLKVAHPERNFTFVEAPYLTPGAGPGRSLLACKEYVPGPFVFTSCDTLVEEQIPLPERDWIGISHAKTSLENYLVYVSSFRGDSFINKPDKEMLSAMGITNQNAYAFIGMAGVKSYEAFWKGLEKGIPNSGEEHEVMAGLLALSLKPDLATPIFTWHDTGTYESYMAARDYFGSSDLLKPEEVTYLEGGKVIKYFEDPRRVQQRASRASLPMIPPITSLGENYYAYDYREGCLFSELPFSGGRYVQEFLEAMSEGLWKPLETETNLRNFCLKFYHGKTIYRLEQMLTRTGILDLEGYIDGELVPSAEELLDLLDWKLLFPPNASNSFLGASDLFHVKTSKLFRCNRLAICIPILPKPKTATCIVYSI
jgi:NDP-sugar pyrophosphorylase family protein